MNQTTTSRDVLGADTRSNRCPHCDGSGEIVRSYSGVTISGTACGGDPMDEYAVRCRACGGSGLDAGTLMVREARELNRRGVIQKRFGYYQHSEPLFARRDGVMRAARARKAFLLEREERDPEEDAIAAGLTWPGRTCTSACGYCGACT